ncbi:MAG TPA: DUF4252 domain-containing protein [Thermoanaerobaculia bacterium]|jgi:hypothetical protein|nr:DUF4252 domain-containing protein [Thermoanaerobaculia bacterium]
MRKTLLPLVFYLAASAALAQPPPPGLVPLDELNLFPRDQLSVEVNLAGGMLHLIAAAAEDDPDFSAIVGGLQSINVQVFPLKGVKAESIKPKIDHAVQWLESRGWKVNVRVRDQGQETFIYMKEQSGKIVGLTVLTFKPGEEAAVINIAGRIDPAQIGRVGQKLHLPQLEKIPARPKKPN